MENSDDIPPKNMELFGSACAAAEMYPDIIAPDEAAFVSEICRHDRELYIRCRDRELTGYVDEVGGLELNLDLNGLRTSLPAFIPIAEGSFFGQEVDIGGDLVGIQLKNVVERSTRRVRTDLLARPLFKGKRVILFMSGRDDLIEPVWDWRHDTPLFEDLGRMGLFAATGINFSVFESMCPCGQHLNIKKSLLSAALLEQAGIPSIPHFYSVNANERKRIVAWLTEHPIVKLITINCQAQKSAHDLAVLKGSIRYILTHAPHGLHIILEGFRIARLAGLEDQLPYLHIAQKQPFMDGLNYTSVILDPKNQVLRGERVSVIKDAKHHLVAQSIRARKEQLSVFHSRIPSRLSLISDSKLWS